MTYIIGEIGQNHNGSVDIAKAIVDVATLKVRDKLFNRDLRGIDAIKLTKRDLNEELTASAMNRPYDSPNAFAPTYGEHRQILELSNEEHFEVYKYVKSKGIDFVETLCSKGCLSLLNLFQPDYLKVASRDLTNLPLLEALAETKIPIIISTGMADKLDLDNGLSAINKYHSNITILHCLSQYPSDYKELNLKSITHLKNNYPNYTIGYSDHSIGIVTPVAAVAMGAEVIEKHITIDRNMKGTDQEGSLASDGIRRMLRDIRNLELSFGEEGIFRSEAVVSAQTKLERSIATNKTLPKGHIIKEQDLHMLSPGDGLKWHEKDKIIGKAISSDIDENEILYPKFVG